MATLSTEEALRLIKEPKHTREIQQAKDKRIRHKLHTEAETDTAYASQSASQFFAWVSEILGNPSTFARFRQLCRPPYATNELVEGIFTSFEKIFESQNAFEKFDFKTAELEQDFAAYRKRIGDFNFWETQGMEAFKNSIDNILVVDLPSLKTDTNGDLIQDSQRPEPYYYLLDINRLIDIDNDKVIASDGQVGKEFFYFKTEYVIFRSPEGDNNLVYVFDDVYYRTFIVDESQVATLVSETAHGLGYCPARSFWTTPLNSSTNLRKRGPITNSLADLDWLLFFQVCERYAQLYLSFPIVAMYKSKCSNSSKADEQGRKCVNGFLEIEGSRFVGSDRVECPKCKQSGKLGPGHVIFIDPPKELGAGGDPDLMANPIKIIPTDTDSLAYVQKRIAEMKNEIRVNCVGRSTDTNDATAKNEMQVESGLESSEAVMIKAKRNFETIHLFGLDTIARLRYGADYLGGVLNYGDEFLQKSEGQEVEEYNAAVLAKAPTYELAERRIDINKARYRNDPSRIKRLEILANLEPFPDMTLLDLVGFQKSNPSLVDEIDIIIKSHLNEFVARFEREVAPITLFGSRIDFSKKIDLIKADLIKYATEYRAKVAIIPVPGPAPVLS